MTRRIGVEVGKSYTLTVGNDQTIVTALASPWAEQRIAQLEVALRRIADHSPLIGGDAIIMRNIAREALLK